MSELIPELDEVALENIAAPEHLEALRRTNPGSYICVPLRVGGHALGAMGLLSGRRYSKEDVVLAEGVAHCAALALNNARHRASEVELVRELVRRAGEGQQVISLPRREAPQITPRQMEVLQLLSSGLGGRTPASTLRPAASACQHGARLRQAPCQPFLLRPDPAALKNRCTGNPWLPSLPYHSETTS